MSNVRDFGAAGDGQADDTDAIQHAVDQGEGLVELGRGDFRVTRPIEIDLARDGRTAISGRGGIAKIIMAGPGPALFLRGTHAQTADPGGFRPEEWQHERMPTVSGLEIEGAHPKADGIRIEGVMQPTLTSVLVRKVRTAVHLTERARNLLISHCHFYHNTGVGIHFDGLNLHQACITGSHVSYNRLGGVRIENSEIRNLQITGNDIEYNNNRAHQVPGADAEPTAEIYVNVENGSVREGTIASNTLQATHSPGGANIRFVGASDRGVHRAGMWAVSGNLIGSQEFGIHLSSCRDVTISGNFIYSAHNRNVLVEDSRNILLGPNTFGHNPNYGNRELATGIRFVDSVNCNITGVLIQDASAGKHTVETIPLERLGLLELVRCRRMNVSGAQVLDGAPYGIYLEDCSETLITGCLVRDTRDEPLMRSAIHWQGPGSGNLVTASRLAPGTQSSITAPDHVTQQNNLTAT